MRCLFEEVAEGSSGLGRVRWYQYSATLTAYVTFKSYKGLQVVS